MTTQEMVAEWREKNEIIVCPEYLKGTWTKESCKRIWERAGEDGFVRRPHTSALNRSRCFECEHGPKGEGDETNPR